MNKEPGRRIIAVIAETGDDLPFSPELLSTLYNQTADESTSSLSDISRTIARDQGLTTRVLKIANSAFYGLQSEVSSVDRALAVLGLAEVRNMVLALGVNSLSASLKKSDILDLEAYWRHQILCACTARMLAGKLDLSPEDMFTCGLLHDLGRLIMAIYAPEEFRAVEKLMAEERMTSSGAEMQLLGLDHGLIGAMSLASWNLPQRLTEPINWHHSPDRGPGFAREASLVFIADAAAHKFENPAYRVDRNWREKMADFGLDEEEIVVELKGLSSDDRLDSLLSALGV